MRFRTTLFLAIIALVVGLIALLGTRQATDQGSSGPLDDRKITPPGPEARFIDIPADEIDRLTLADAGGNVMELTQQKGRWRVIKPINWPANTTVVTRLVESIGQLQPVGTLSMQAPASAANGLAPPRFTVQVHARSGQTAALLVGNQSPLGSDLFMQVKGRDGVYLAAGGVLGQCLGVPFTERVNDLRSQQLTELSSAAVVELSTQNASGTARLVKNGDDWTATTPVQFKADRGAVDQLIVALCGLSAQGVTDEATAQASGARLQSPILTVRLRTAGQEKPGTVDLAAIGHPSGPAGLAAIGPASSAAGAAAIDHASGAASTAPADANGEPATTIVVGQPAFDADQVWVKVTTPGGLTTFARAALAPEVMASLRSPGMLRDRTVLNIVPRDVVKIVVEVKTPTTTRPARGASDRQVTLWRRGANGPAAFASQSLLAAAAAPAVADAMGWSIDTPQGEQPADGAKVESLLSVFAPFRVMRYVEAGATRADGATFHVTLTRRATGGASPANVEDFTFYEDQGRLLGAYHDLAFEVDRGIEGRMEVDYRARKK